MSDERGITRRRALRDLALAGLGAAGIAGTVDDLVAHALAASPKHGTLADIDHVVILIQENRSFDHYFGSYPGVRGFGDRHNRSVFHQRSSTGSKLSPFHFATNCMADLTHDWGPQHQSWNSGRMNQFVTAHQAAGDPGPEETMGYYDGRDLRFYHALADKFTICDGYHCSVLGPTDPNRLLSLSAWLDPAGTHGGPLVKTISDPSQRQGRFSWTTMPERLSAHGISWKVYNGGGGAVLDNVLTYFKQYTPPSKLYDRGVAPTYPADFLFDLEHKRLPQVSWLLLGLGESEHPGYSTPQAGEIGARQVVQSLVSHPDIWKRTALFITWDENGGFFDHVAPPTPPPGTKGEYLTVAQLPGEANGIRGPLGLGFRVPMLVVSPFSRGGLVCSDVFDHTSTLRFLETRFGVRVPNLTSWRRKATGDLTSAFNFAARPNHSRPSLPHSRGSAVCATSPPVPATSQPFPQQRPGKRRRPSGIVPARTPSH